MVTANILQRLLKTKYGNSIGTAFTIEINERQFLISAKHIFKGIKKDFDVIFFLRDNDWISLDVHPIFCDDPSVDIIAFTLDRNLTTKLPILIGQEGAILSQDVYFLGYPYGMQHKINTFDGFPLPLVKKAIISAFDYPILWFDGHNNPGFSGGPIVISRAGSSPRVISVVSGFLPDHKSSENSGIFLGYSLDLIVDAIQKYMNKL